jgi:hypothetical protein
MFRNDYVPIKKFLFIDILIMSFIHYSKKFDMFGLKPFSFIMF